MPKASSGTDGKMLLEPAARLRGELRGDCAGLRSPHARSGAFLLCSHSADLVTAHRIPGSFHCAQIYAAGCVNASAFKGPCHWRSSSGSGWASATARGHARFIMHFIRPCSPRRQVGGFSMRLSSRSNRSRSIRIRWHQVPGFDSRGGGGVAGASVACSSCAAAASRWAMARSSSCTLLRKMARSRSEAPGLSHSA